MCQLVSSQMDAGHSSGLSNQLQPATDTKKVDRCFGTVGMTKSVHDRCWRNGEYPCCGRWSVGILIALLKFLNRQHLALAAIPLVLLPWQPGFLLVTG
jgi:hypothetical protein